LDFFETKGYPLLLILTLVVRSNDGGAPSGLTVAGYPYSKVVPWLLTGGGSNLLYEALFLTRFLPMVSQRRDVTQPFCNPLEVEMIDGGLVTVAREASQRRSQLGVDELEMKFRKGSTRV
jgi:hypothetical protein